MKLDARMPLEEIANQLGFMGGEIVEDDMNLLPGQAPRPDTSSKKATKSRLVWRAAVLPCTRPVLVSSAAYSESVLCRKYSNPWRSAQAGRERQNRVEPIQSLNRGLFIDTTRPRVAADAGTNPEYRPLCFRTRDRRWPCNAPGGGV